MPNIKNIEELTVDQINKELSRGAKFVMFPYCISLIIITMRRSSDIYFIREGDSTLIRRFGFILLSLLFGWWGFPWGPIYTIGSVFQNLTGGKDVTEEIVKAFNSNIKQY